MLITLQAVQDGRITSESAKEEEVAARALARLVAHQAAAKDLIWLATPVSTSEATTGTLLV
jgi:prephenate dehydrogenase